MNRFPDIDAHSIPIDALVARTQSHAERRPADDLTAAGGSGGGRREARQVCGYHPTRPATSLRVRVQRAPWDRIGAAVWRSRSDSVVRDSWRLDVRAP